MPKVEDRFSGSARVFVEVILFLTDCSGEIVFAVVPAVTEIILDHPFRVEPVIEVPSVWPSLAFE